MPLPPKAADLLVALLEGEGHLVAKEELLLKVWPGTFGAHASLTFQIHLLRHALRDGVGGVDGKLYVENLPRRGYRIAGLVTRLPVEPAAEEPPQTEVSPSDTLAREQSVEPTLSLPAHAAGWRLNWRAGVAVAASIAALGIVGTIVIHSAQSPLLRVTRYTQLTHDERLKHLNVQLVSDGKRVIVSRVASQLAVSAANGQAVDLEILKEFYVLDASLVRSEFLATRPTDRGAEKGLWAVPFQGESPRRLGQILADTAAWSPDGRRFAYRYDNSLYVADASGTIVQNLATVAGSPTWIRWSPDGLRLRFTANSSSDRTFTQRLWEVRSDGTERRPLLDDWPGSSQTCCGEWMPDGENFIFQVRQPNREDLWLLHERKRLFRRPTHETVQLTSGPISFTSPMSSLDGQRILAIGTTHVTRLERYDASTQRFRTYVDGLSAWAVDFSRDGKEFVYVQHPDNTLWRAKADGSGKRQLTFPPMEADGCAWSPDGTQIAFRGRLPRKHTKVYLIPASGGTPMPLSAADVEQGMPSWSHDGMRLAFGDVPETFAHPTGTETIHLYDFRRRELTFPRQSAFVVEPLVP